MVLEPPVEKHDHGLCFRDCLTDEHIEETVQLLRETGTLGYVRDSLLVQTNDTQVEPAPDRRLDFS